MRKLIFLIRITIIVMQVSILNNQKIFNKKNRYHNRRAIKSTQYSFYEQSKYK